MANSTATKAVYFIYRLRYRGEGTINRDDFTSVQTVLTEQFEVFTGRKTYIVTLNCLETIRFNKNDIEIDAWVIAPAAIDPNKPDQKPRLTSTRIFLSADNSKDILQIKTKTGFGTIDVLLTDFAIF